MTTYSEKLLDPRWQRRRLEIFQRSNFTCESCGAANKTLHVHHTFYRKGKEPWDYPDHALIPLCVDCHGDAEQEMEEIRALLGSIDRNFVAEVRGYLKGLLLLSDGVDMRRAYINSYEEAEGFLKSWTPKPLDRLAVEALLALLGEKGCIFADSETVAEIERIRATS